jgi:hypothetical protein
MEGSQNLLPRREKDERLCVALRTIDVDVANVAFSDFYQLED